MQCTYVGYTYTYCTYSMHVFHINAYTHTVHTLGAQLPDVADSVEMLGHGLPVL